MIVLRYQAIRSEVMSNNVNEQLLERAKEALSLADYWSEYWVGTLHEDLLTQAAETAVQHIEDNNLDDLFSISVPKLDGHIKNAYQAAFELEYQPNAG